MKRPNRRVVAASLLATLLLSFLPATGASAHGCEKKRKTETHHPGKRSGKQPGGHKGACRGKH